MNPSPFNTKRGRGERVKRRKGEKGSRDDSALCGFPSSPLRLFILSPFHLFLMLIVALSLVFAVACKHGATSALERAAAAWDAGDYTQAAEEYERFLYQYPTGESSLAARLKLANIYYLNLHRYDQALAHYQEFLRQDGAHADAALARERLAEVLAELGRTYEAINEYEILNPFDVSERRRIRLKIADL